MVSRKGPAGTPAKVKCPSLSDSASRSSMCPSRSSLTRAEKTKFPFWSTTVPLMVPNDSPGFWPGAPCAAGLPSLVRRARECRCARSAGLASGKEGTRTGARAYAGVVLAGHGAATGAIGVRCARQLNQKTRSVPSICRIEGRGSFPSNCCWECVSRSGALARRKQRKRGIPCGNAAPA